MSQWQGMGQHKKYDSISGETSESIQQNEGVLAEER
jgi:hypothetical protein